MTYELVAADTMNTEQIRDLRAIYEGAYTDEHASWSRVYTNRPSSEVPLALVSGDVAVGFVLLRGVADGELVFVRYLAIAPGQRGHGLGAHFWQLLTAYAIRRGYRRLVWDVGPTGEPSNESDEPATLPDRIGLHERTGGALLPIGEYADAAAGTNRSAPVRLLATSLGDAAPIDARTLGRLALDVYAYRYEIALESAVRAPPGSIAEHEP